MALYEKQQIQRLKQNIHDIENGLEIEKGRTKNNINRFVGEMQQLEEKLLESEGIDHFFVKCCQLFSPNGVIRLGVLYQRELRSFDKNSKQYAVSLEELGKCAEYIKDFRLNNLILEKIYNITSQTEETLIVYKDGRVELATTRSVFDNND